VRHLFCCAGFGADRQQLEAAVQKTPLQVVDELLEGREPAEYSTEMQTLATAAISGGNVEPLSAWWVYRILSTPAQLLEKTVVFWHGHFATGADKVTEPQLTPTSEPAAQKAGFWRLSSAGAADLERSGDAAVSGFGFEPQGSSE
jgi:hypothetical protein